METLNIGRWIVKCDPKTTRNAFTGVVVGSPESCGCEDCLNFVAVRERVYPPDALLIFERLGVVQLEFETKIFLGKE